MKSDASLRGKVRHLANEHDLKPQEVLQMYLFEHLLMRLAKSSYADKFSAQGWPSHLVHDWNLPTDDDGHGYDRRGHGYG